MRWSFVGGRWDWGRRAGRQEAVEFEFKSMHWKLAGVDSDGTYRALVCVVGGFWSAFGQWWVSSLSSAAAEDNQRRPAASSRSQLGSSSSAYSTLDS